MFNNLTYQKKIKLLAVVSIIVSLVCYQFSFKKTFEEYQLYKKSSSSASKAQHANSYAESIQVKQGNINKLFDQYAVDSINPAKNLLSIVSQYCEQNNIQLKEYKPYGICTANNINILTRSITVEGDFVHCLKLLYELETQKKAGRVSSVVFKTYQDTRTKKTVLNCSIFIQNIIPVL